MTLTTKDCEAIINKYPFLKPRNVWTGEEDPEYDYSYLAGMWEIPEGWHRLFLLYCKHIHPHLERANMLDKYTFTQVKEKYGTLRIYDSGYPKSAYYLADLFESFSKYVCPICGRYPTKYETAGWVTYLCEECAEESSCVMFSITKQKYMHIESWSNNTAEHIMISYKNIKKEYEYIRSMSDEEFIAYILKD